MKSVTSEAEESRRLRSRLGAAAVVVCVVAGAVVWSLLPPPLPRLVRIGTGPEGSHYAAFGEALRQRFVDSGVELEVVPTGGSRANVEALRAGEIDVGIVTGGILADDDSHRLESIASVFYEPVLIFYRADWSSDSPAGGRIAIGQRGSGTHALASDLLADQGITNGEPVGTRLVEIGGEQAVAALRSGEVDSAIFVTTLSPPWVKALFEDPDLKLENLDLAEAFTRHYRFLRRSVIPAGLINLRDEIPAEDVQVVVTTASLVMRPDLHRALVPLFIATAQAELYQGTLLAKPEELPSPHHVDAPLAAAARAYFERGPSFFYRWLPFEYAFAATRLMLLTIPLLTLLYPVLRSAGPTYRWLAQRRVFRWYRVLRRLEMEMDASAADPVGRERIAAQLERVGEEIRATRVPARYAADLFHLRNHHRLLVERMELAVVPGGGRRAVR
jgi:TRAP-type uncharacterized transport system substrate-binding protein